jgi:hypothetical protein
VAFREVPDFPELFEAFMEKQLTLLWRGSRDGFGKDDFYSRCDGHSNTLSLILDAKGDIFGGFTPVEWDSTRYGKGDPSVKGFIFTLKNPHSVPPRRFALKAEKKNEAIWCHSDCGPHFQDICLLVTATQTPEVTPTRSASLTLTTPDWKGTSFSRVRSISK